MFPLSNSVQYLPVFTYSHENFLIGNFIKQLIFCIFLQIHIWEASNLLTLWVSVDFFAAYKALLQTKHFIIHFFSYRFSLPVNNCFLHKHFLCHLNSAQNLMCNVHPLILSYLNIWIGSLIPLVHQHKLSVYWFHFGLCTSPSSFFTLIFIGYSLMTLFGLSISSCNPFLTTSFCREHGSLFVWLSSVLSVIRHCVKFISVHCRCNLAMVGCV